MATKKRPKGMVVYSPTSTQTEATEELQKLKKKNLELRRKIKAVEKERDQYLSVVHGYIKSTINLEELLDWPKEGWIEGSLVEFFQKAKNETAKRA
jgi:hypothetical protein